MKQKIVLKVHMNGDKSRTKAMKIAAVTAGVTSVTIAGADKDQLVVIGDEIDLSNLTRELRKKVGYATIVTVKVEKKEEEKKKEIISRYCQNLQYPMYYQVVNDPYPTNCSIM